MIKRMNDFALLDFPPWFVASTLQFDCLPHIRSNLPDGKQQSCIWCRDWCHPALGITLDCSRPIVPVLDTKRAHCFRYHREQNEEQP